MNSVHFHEKHQVFINSHISRRSGERKGRLERGHQHAEALFLEQVWFPLIGNFEHLHPEYEVIDWRGRSYFGDFAYLPGEMKFIWEIKGFGPHVQDMDRKRYCEELNREIFLQALGFRVVSFAYDDVSHRPELCITLLRMLLSRFPVDVKEHFAINHRTAVRLLQSLTHQRMAESNQPNHRRKNRPIRTRAWSYGFCRLTGLVLKITRLVMKVLNRSK